MEFLNMIRNSVSVFIIDREYMLVSVFGSNLSSKSLNLECQC